MEALTVVEEAKLENLEIVISNGRKAFLEVGRALDVIKKERLYRVTFLTFEEYLATRWNMGTSHAYRMIDAAHTVDEMSPIGDKVGWQPQAEGQVRELASVPEEHRETVLSEAVKEYGATPTAAQIKEVASSVVNQDVDRPQVDTGFVGEIDLQQDDAETKALESDDEAFRWNIRNLRALIDNREPAQLIGWEQDINDLRKYISQRRQSR